MVHAPRAGTPAATRLPQSFEPIDFLLGRRGAGRPLRGVAGGKVNLLGRTPRAGRGYTVRSMIRHLLFLTLAAWPLAAQSPSDLDRKLTDKIEIGRASCRERV